MFLCSGPKNRRKSNSLAVGVIRRTIVRGHIGIEKLDPYAIALASLGRSGEVTQIPDNAFVRIKTKQPVKLQLCTCNLQQKSTMSRFSNAARRDILIPCSICDDQCDFRVLAENFQRLIRTRIIICDDRIHVLANVIQRVA